MNKQAFSERDFCSKYIAPALQNAGWNLSTQVREEFSSTMGRIIVRGKLHSRGTSKRADYVLIYKPGIPIVVIEAKDNSHSLGAGMQQALGYTELFDIPFAFSSNRDGFLFHNNFNMQRQVEQEISLQYFTSPQELWDQWKHARRLEPEQESIVNEDYYSDGSNKSSRYYQLLVINKTMEAIAKEQNRILLVMANNTGKTFTAFQIIWRLWKSRTKKRILFLADRNLLVAI